MSISAATAVAVRLEFVLQKRKKLFRQLEKVGRFRFVVFHELTDHVAPLIIRVDLLEHGEHRAQKVVEVVKEQAAINGQAPLLDALGRRRVGRVAQVGRKCILLVLKFRSVRHWPHAGFLCGFAVA